MTRDGDLYWIGVAEAVSKASDCVRRKVGAVIVFDDGTEFGRLAASGFNTAPDGKEGRPKCDQGECERGTKSLEECPPGRGYGNCIARHAEIWAVLNLSGHYWAFSSYLTLYVNEPPCEDCRRDLKRHGLRAVWKGMAFE